MKKLFVFLATLAVAALSFTSCDKDSGNKGSDSLTGTVWAAKIISSPDKDDDTGYVFVRFDNASNCSIYSDFDVEHKVVRGTYTYSAPSISMTFSDSGKTTTMAGTIKGNKMTVNHPDDLSTDVIFTRR